MDPKQGGVCQALRSIIAGLKDHEVSNEVVTLDEANTDAFALDNFTIHALGNGQGPWSYNKKLMPWLLDNLNRFDRVIMHGLWLYPGYALSKALARIKKSGTAQLPKLLVMPHGMLDPYFQKAKNRKLKAIRNVLYWKFIESQLINKSDGMLFTCQEEASLASTTFSPYTPKRELVVGLGVDAPPVYTEDMKRAFNEKCEGLNNTPYLLFLSRIDEKKGVDLLINAYSSCLKNINNKHIQTAKLPKLVIAGPGLDSPYGKKIQQLVAQDKDLQRNVIFPGMLSGNAKWGAFYGCEAFILPSHQENFGIAVVEALSCGKPVLISDQVNIWREIETAGGGFVRQNTLEGTSQLLKYWEQARLDDKKLLARNAISAYRKNFSPAPATKKLLNALSETI